MESKHKTHSNLDDSDVINLGIPSNLKKKKEKPDSNISYSDEIRRKLVHLFSLNIALIYIHLDKLTAFWIMLGLTIATVSFDILSKKSKFFGNLFFKYVSAMLRKHEIKKNKFRLNGASWLAISASLTILLFPKLFAVVALSIMIISDISSALIGRKFGKIPFFKKKTLEGSVAFFVSASLVIFIFTFVFHLSNYFLFFGLISALVTTFSEAISKVVKLDDNLLVPITFGAMMLIFELVLNHYSITMMINM
jgi:dolichol kinase